MTNNGFCPGCSTLYAHIAIVDTISRHLDSPDINSVVLLAFDLSKAFDRLPYDKLLQSLTENKLPPDFICWCSHYYYERRQKVILRGVSSTEKATSSGVPQGSIISPFLFASFMGSLSSKSIDTKIFKYADDFCLLIPSSKDSNINDSIHVEIKNIEDWCSIHGLVLNRDKTRLMVFGKSGCPLNLPTGLTVVSELKILGLTFQQNLKWDSHIDNVTKKASQRIFLLKKLKRIPGVSKNDLLSVYKSYIASILEYNCPVFMNMTQKSIRKIERVRKRCHYIICDCGDYSNCRLLPSFIERADKIALRTFSDILKPNNFIYHLAPRRLPVSGHFEIPLSHSMRRSSTFFPYCTRLFNKMYFASQTSD